MKGNFLLILIKGNWKLDMRPDCWPLIQKDNRTLYYILTLLFPLEMSIDICTFGLLTSHISKGPSALVLTNLSHKRRSISISTLEQNQFQSLIRILLQK